MLIIDFLSYINCLFLQLALIDLLHSVGISPDALIGISTGELTCAYIDGAVTAEQVMQIAYHTALWSKNSSLPPATLAVICKLQYVPGL